MTIDDKIEKNCQNLLCGPSKANRRGCKINSLESDISGHGSVKVLWSGSKREGLGHISVLVRSENGKFDRLRSLGNLVVGGEGGGRASKEKGVDELHFVVCLKTGLGWFGLDVMNRDGRCLFLLVVVGWNAFAAESLEKAKIEGQSDG